MHSFRPRQLLPLLAPSLWTNSATAQLQIDRGVLNIPDPLATAASSPSTPSSAAAASSSNAAAPTATPAPSDSDLSTPSPAASSPSPAAATPTASFPASLPTPTSNAAPSSTSASPALNSGSSPSAVHASSVATSSPTPTQSLKSQPSSIIYLTITATGSDGNVYTSVSSTASALPAPTGASPPNSGGSSSGNTWAIIGGVVGGLAALAAIIFIVFRCTQRRFSELDDEDVAIKWPELVNRTDDSTTLNPLAARQAAGHGVGDDGEDEKPGLPLNQGLYSDHAYASELNRGDTVQSTMYSNSSYGPGPLGYGECSGYYPDDPYLGPTSAPQPFPPSIPYELQPHPPYAPLAPPSPYSGSRSISPGTGIDREPEGYQMSWGGAEAIPLTVVNSSNGTATKRRTLSSPEHGVE